MKILSLPITLARYCWSAGNSLRTTLWLIVMLVADLLVGYRQLLSDHTIFEPMNQVGLYTWTMTYARSAPFRTAWFLLLLLLLGLFTLNTLICTLTRLKPLLRKPFREIATRRRRVAIHLMHLGIVIILSGYLVSYTWSTVHPSLTLIPRHPILLDNPPLRLELRQMQLAYYAGDRLAEFRGRILAPQLTLEIDNPRSGHRTSATLAFNHPIFFQGYSIFLQRFHPTRHRGITTARYAVVEVRRDPGVKLYFIGILVFLTGLIFFSEPFSTVGQQARGLSCDKRKKEDKNGHPAED